MTTETMNNTETVGKSVSNLNIVTPNDQVYTETIEATEAPAEVVTAPKFIKINYASGSNVAEAYAKTSIGIVNMQENIEAEIANLTRTQKASELDPVVFANTFLNSDKAEPGKVYCVVLTKPVSNSRLKPFKVQNVAATAKRKYLLSYELIVDGNTIVGSADNKFDAISTAKGLVASLEKDIEVRVIKKVVEGEEITATINFAPSKNAKQGTYLFFTVK